MKYHIRFFVACLILAGFPSSGLAGLSLPSTEKLLEPPRNLRFALEGMNLTLRWDPVAGASGYTLAVGKTSGGYDAGVFDAGNVTEIGPADIRDLPAGSHYYVAARSYSEAGESEYSNEMVVKAPIYPPGPFIATDVLDLLLDDLPGHYSGANFGKIISFVSFFGVEPFLTAAALVYPGLYSRIPNGILVNFGDGYAGKDGLFHTGSVQVTFSHPVRGRGNFAAGYSVLVKDVWINGKYLADGFVHGTVDVRAVNYSGATADITLRGLFYGASGPVTLSGTAHFDTGICPYYPVLGRVDVIDNDRIETISLTNACDGSYERFAQELRQE